MEHGDVLALLFDLDGTLIDSMPHHQSAWAEWHRRRGLAIDEAAFFIATAGRANAEILADMWPGRTAAEYAAMATEKEELYRKFAAPALTLIAGAERYVAEARAAGLKLAVCTASTLPNMAVAFARFDIESWVDAVVSPADRATGPSPGTDRPQGRSESGLSPADGLPGKPNPDIFLEAARRLGVAPGRCVVFEDAPLGVEAARRAGMRAVALTTTLGAEAFAGFDNLIATVPDFDSVPDLDSPLLPVSRPAT